MDLTLDSGNFLAREHKWKHPLMFCYHEKYYFGAKPGMAGILYMLLTRNPKNNNKTDYLEAAERCAEVIWKRGILHCGYGLSDGTAGKAYAFLAMYKRTKKNLYLHRAIKFAEWCCDFGKHDCPNPEFPCSLFEGLAGAVYFLSDILNPETACFPAFELT